MSEPEKLDFLLKKMAASHRPELPSPSLIWWRAEIARKQGEKERIERPLLAMRQAAVVICVVMLAGLLAGNLGEMQAMLGQSAWFVIAGLGIVAAACAVSAAVLFASPAE